MVYAAIVELLLELEGVDPEPDFWAPSCSVIYDIIYDISVLVALDLILSVI